MRRYCLRPDRREQTRCYGWPRTDHIERLQGNSAQAAVEDTETAQTNTTSNANRLFMDSLPSFETFTPLPAYADSAKVVVVHCARRIDVRRAESICPERSAVSFARERLLDPDALPFANALPLLGLETSFARTGG